MRDEKTNGMDELGSECVVYSILKMCCLSANHQC